MESLVFLILPIVILVFMAIFLLGWIWPLTAGIIKTRRGNKSVGLIIFGGVWGGLAALGGILIAIGIFTVLRFQNAYNVPEFDMAAYEGPTASIVTSYKGDSSLRFRVNTDDSQQACTINSTDGTFTVPAGKIELQSYSVSARNKDNKYWSVYWSHYSNKDEGTLDLKADETVDIKADFPLSVSVTRKNMADEKQSINIKVTDANGKKVSLRSDPAPSIEILDKDENVVWTHKLSYG